MIGSRLCLADDQRVSDGMYPMRFDFKLVLCVGFSSHRRGLVFTAFPFSIPSGHHVHPHRRRFDTSSTNIHCRRPQHDA